MYLDIQKYTYLQGIPGILFKIGWLTAPNATRLNTIYE